MIASNLGTSVLGDISRGFDKDTLTESSRPESPHVGGKKVQDLILADVP